MSKDGGLPDNIRDCDLPGNRPQDRKCELPCPCADGYVSEVYDKYSYLIDPVCICADLLADAKADEADFRRDYKRELK